MKSTRLLILFCACLLISVGALTGCENSERYVTNSTEPTVNGTTYGTQDVDFWDGYYDTYSNDGGNDIDVLDEGTDDDSIVDIIAGGDDGPDGPPDGPTMDKDGGLGIFLPNR